MRKEKFMQWTWQGLDAFQKSFRPFALDESSFRIWKSYRLEADSIGQKSELYFWWRFSLQVVIHAYSSHRVGFSVRVDDTSDFDVYGNFGAFYARNHS